MHTRLLKLEISCLRHQVLQFESVFQVVFVHFWLHCCCLNFQRVAIFVDRWVQEESLVLLRTVSTVKLKYLDFLFFWFLIQ